MAELTKEEALTLIEVMSKNATNLEKISNSLETSTSALKEINTRLHNGLGKEIVENIVKELNRYSDDEIKEAASVSKILEEIKENTAATKLDSRDLKFFVGLVSICVILVTSFVTVITKVLDDSSEKMRFHNQVVEMQKISEKK